MTEQPKFQRRKRRGAASAAQAPAASDAAVDHTEPDVQSLLAEKEALLQRQAELEALSNRKPSADRQTDNSVPTQTIEDVVVEPKTPPAKPQPPLVLAQAPDPATKAEPAQVPVYNPEEAWAQLDRFPLDPTRLAKHNIVTALRDDPAHTRFDILRTRMLQALAENGWKRVAITSPTKDCGKTFTAANLAISLSRQENCKTVLLDLDMRSPNLHRIFGVSDCGVIGDMLRGDISPERHLQGFGPNDISAGSHVAIGFNGVTEPYASELLQDPTAEAVLKEVERVFDPDVMLFDLPPALLNDDVLAMRPHFDALLLVAAGGSTRANDIKETERRLGENVPFLGIVLNKAEQEEAGDYAY